MGLSCFVPLSPKTPQGNLTRLLAHTSWNMGEALMRPFMERMKAAISKWSPGKKHVNDAERARSQYYDDFSMHVTTQADPSPQRAKLFEARS